MKTARKVLAMVNTRQPAKVEQRLAIAATCTCCYNATMPPANLSLDQERGQLPPLPSLAVSILLLDLFFLSTSHFGNIPILYQQNATKTEVETYSKPNWIKEQLH